ncbi:PREDICTED: ornithine decarboxylase 2-like [Wasmannia auropunctata]|uniref:ornithine decarboxylase 2-like n=1 Tax=Wasmannia auropunctata TaxID=64793 RepID=UPI0005ED9196|nr:PREDICTED: ornithine decarboxylase 2-like [Wasmannia auropunctata]XP_011694195.1 PREDICTED: ornithine decarboxylase 2-like [Wasmannia auropunctata]
MSPYDFNEVKIIDDAADNMDVIKTIINRKNQEDGFYIVDIGDIINKHREWITKIPRVAPHYAVKCNPDPNVIKILAALNTGFDCASEQEIRQVMQYGVQPDRIIFANPYKSPSHIKYAKKMNVDQITADSELELLKIKDLYPEAKIVVRIRCDAKNSDCDLGLKFGCEPDENAVRLIQFTMNLGLTLHGFSFHVGSPCRELNAYSRGIGICKRLITIAQSMGCKDVQLIDIGGGFPGERGTDIDKLANIVNDAIQDLDPSIRIISEPGRYYVESAFTLTAFLHSKKIVHKNGKLMRMYYTNVGTFNSFLDEMLGLKARVPQTLFEPASDKKFLSTLWGPTCDSYDLIVKDVLLPELHIGDWLVWKDIGSYTLSLCTAFNGFPIPKVTPFIRKSQWKNLLMEIKLMQRSME